jgi:hypothetical protein
MRSVSELLPYAATRGRILRIRLPKIAANIREFGFTNPNFVNPVSG